MYSRRTRSAALEKQPEKGASEGPTYKKKSRAVVRKSRKSGKKDHIRTAADVRAVIERTHPIKFWIHPPIATTASTAASLVMNLTNIPFNSDATAAPAGSSRQSRKVYINRIKGRFLWTVGDSTNVVRLLLVRPKKDQTTSFVPNDAFESNTGANAITWLTQPNYKNMDVLYDKTWNLASAAVGGLPTFVTDEFDVPFHRTATYPLAANAAYPQPTNLSSAYMIVISDSSAVAHPRFAVETQVVFRNL